MKNILILIILVAVCQCVEADNNTFINNTLTNADIGLLIDSKENITLINNTICTNTLDINVTNSIDVTGDNNTCNTILNYNDTGETGCTYACAGEVNYTGVCLNANLTCGAYPCNQTVNITDTCKCGHTNAFLVLGSERNCAVDNSWGNYTLTVNSASYPFNGNIFPMQLLNYYMARGYGAVYAMFLIIIGVYFRRRWGR